MEISGNVYGFWDNGVWRCLGNFSEVSREYMWASVNVLPNSPKISHLTKETFSYSIVLGLTQNWDESSAVFISAVIVTHEHVDSPKVF